MTKINRCFDVYSIGVGKKPKNKTIDIYDVKIGTIILMAAARPHAETSIVIAYEKDKKPVRLVHDTWTPRPHFIVVQCEPKQDADAAELQATYEIIGLFLHENSQFDDDAILSFHRGQWYQQHTGKWHAHLSVPKQHYLNQASSRVIQFDS